MSESMDPDDQRLVMSACGHYAQGQNCSDCGVPLNVRAVEQFKRPDRPVMVHIYCTKCSRVAGSHLCGADFVDSLSRNISDGLGAARFEAEPEAATIHDVERTQLSEAPRPGPALPAEADGDVLPDDATVEFLDAADELEDKIRESDISKKVKKRLLAAGITHENFDAVLKEYEKETG